MKNLHRCHYLQKFSKYKKGKQNKDQNSTDIPLLSQLPPPPPHPPSPASRGLKINMTEGKSLEFILRKIDKTRNYLLEEIEHNYLMIEKYKKTCK